MTIKRTIGVDFTVQNEGNIFLFRPHTRAARSWIADNIPNEAQTFGNAVVVEHRYILAIVKGIQESGLGVQ
jgi:hypothetical protein